ncbi:glycosyltransferase family 4 protein [Acetobacter fallax]|uniref:Glycosyltransferase n=1 Tax=Acetobacter fallax TaxID=1737473 RepID=A0ABX0KAS2_9PROT|nr:glycosyltransferase family 4 protein [Acetobacter fallax]NHO32873.1 glycosyltransferase [Acetobacter fallax]NHO36435.1 glycosyltransferase [Acetobacter fallax]
MSVPSRRPVILQVLPALDAGGVERGTIEMVEAITRAGGVALVASEQGRLVPKVEYYGGRHIPLNLGDKSPYAILRNASRLKSLIATEGVDLVHARSRAPAWAARLATRSRQARFVTTWHGVHSESFPGKKTYNSVLASGDRVIAISHFIGDRLMRDYDVSPDRLRIIPRGADTRQFDPDCIRGNRIQALVDAWDIAEDLPVILMPGRLTEWKGQTLLLDALAIMTREGWSNGNWVCVFVGEAPERSDFPEELKALVETLGLQERVRFGGHCADMPAAMALSELVVVPSLKPEPFGRVVVEAQAMARPVIVAAHGAAMETVVHGETGILVPPGDARVLAEMIVATLNASDEQRAAMGQRARMSVLAHYTTGAMQESTLAVYDELLGTSLSGVTDHMGAEPQPDYSLTA